MVEIEIDGKKVEVAEGSMVMDAATQLGLYVPHFCYHKKLSIAANCRMCLVEVEKAPKPLPACATPVAAGMKVYTQSAKAKQAQKSVMEFLLINHPLDCPICDQGGECQLQDLAVGYGPSASRYTEEKRVVFHKPMGPLISAEEMSRCIHCTRCVRFGQEIAGVMELGMAGRGEHSEIMSFVGNAIESELSGNMIDVCPVGALTSKPFRYSARTWELSRRKSVSPHDSIGANIVVQSKNNQVMRVVPLENEAVNECWISDRDRFSYEGLHSDKRLLVPMSKDAQGHWHEISWEAALAKAAQLLKSAADHGPNRVRSLASPNSTLEELALVARLTRALNSDSVDFRPRLGQGGFDQYRSGPLSLGMRLAEVSQLERVFVVGSSLREDHPLLAQRIRQAVRHGARVAVLNGVAQDLLMPVSAQLLRSPEQWVRAMAEVTVAVAKELDKPVPESLSSVKPDASAKAVAQLLTQSVQEPGAVAIFLGNSVMAHPQAAALWANAQLLAQMLGARVGFTIDGANGVGGYLAAATPVQGGHDAATMFNDAAECYLLLNVEPALDCANPQRAMAALSQAKSVISLSSYKDSSFEVASLVLPIAAFTETSGSYINCEGRLQSVQAAVRAHGQSRPGWKVLRVLGNLVGASDFEFDSSEEIRAEVVGSAIEGECLSAVVSSATGPQACSHEVSAGGAKAFQTAAQSEASELVRLGSLPIYRSDNVVRHAPALQHMRVSQPPKVLMNPADVTRLGLATGAKVKASQGKQAAVFDLLADAAVAPGVVQLASGFSQTAALGDLVGPIRIEAAT